LLCEQIPIRGILMAYIGLKANASEMRLKQTTARLWNLELSRWSLSVKDEKPHQGGIVRFLENRCGKNRRIAGRYELGK